MAKITNQGLNSALHQLWVFSLSGDFWQVLDTAFGTEYNRENAQILRLQWQKGDFSQLPQIEIVDSGILGDGNGAYSSSENRIYLSSKLIEKGTLGLVSKVLIEEIGHYVDAYINTVDSPGDEGAIFAALVLGEVLSPNVLAELRNENDGGWLEVNGQNLEVEYNNPTVSLSLTSPSTVTEDGPQNLFYVFSRTGDVKNSLTVNFNVSGSATLNDDYVQRGATSFGTSTGSATFAAGSSVVTLSLDPSSDVVSDGNETVALTLAAGTGYAVGTSSAVTGTILDNDVAPGTVVRGSVAKSEYFRTRHEYRNSYAFAALKSDGSVVTWGAYWSGGNSSSVSSSLTSGVTQIFSTLGAFAALKSDGSVVTWGDSRYGGNSSSVSSQLTSGVTQIFSTFGAFAALKSDGSVVTWGDSWGGNSSSVSSSLTSGVTQIFSTGSAFAALKSDGSVVTWGDSSYGGNSSSVSSSLTSGVTQIFSTGHAFAALKSDGSVVTWGDSIYGGNSSSVSSSLTSGVTQIFSNAWAFAALKSDGSVVTWGFSTSGGDSSSVSSSLTSGVTQIFSTGYAFAALKSDGSVVTWGYSDWGGNSSSVSSSLTSGVTQIFSNTWAFAALKSDGSVVTWGDSSYGGNSSSVSSSLTSGVTQIFSNTWAFAALKSDGSVVTWGDSSYGGNSSSVSSSLTSGVTQIFSTELAFAALKSDGSVVTWGYSSYGGNSSSVSSQLTSGVVSFADPFNDDRLVPLSTTPTTPTITLAVNPSSVTEDGTTNLVYTLTRTGDLANSLIVNVNGGGTAVLGTDFSISGPIGQSTSGSIASVTFAAGSSTATVIVDPIPNSIPGGNKTVFATLAPGVGYNIGTVGAVTGTILEDDVVAPTLAIAPTNAIQTEGNSGTKAFPFTVTRSGDTTSSSSANWAVTGFGTNQADVTDFGGTLPTGTVNFTAGETSKTIIVDVLGDTTVEPDEGFTVTLSNPTNATIATATAVGIIQNDDAGVALPIITLAVNPSSVTEDGPQNLFYIFSRTGDKTNSLTVNFNVSGSATLNDDYVQRGATSFGTSTGSATFAAGFSVVTLSLDPSSDVVSDGNETVALTLAAGTGYAVGTSSAVTGTILDNDVAPGTVVRGSVAKSEYFRTRHEYPNSYYAFAALKSDGSVVTWGDSSYGGNSSSVSSSLTSGVTQIFSTFGAFAALKSDGSVVTWGNSGWGGNSSSVSSSLTSGVTQIFSTLYAFAALKSDGSVVTWGDSIYGGNSSSVSSSLSSGVTQIFSTVSAFAALKSDGSVVTWGDSSYGGNSSSVSSSLTSGVTQIFSTGYAFAALKSDGSVVTWGDSIYGGNSSSVSSSLTSGVTQIFSNAWAFAALKSDGSVVTWGFSTSGGDSSSVSSSLTSGVTQIFSTELAFAALKSDGSVVTWGYSDWGGNSSSVSSSLTSGVTQIFSTNTAFAALKSDGSVVTWGYSSYGGNSSSVSSSLTSGVTQIFSTSSAFAALKSDGSVVTWGDSGNGGNSSSVSSSLTSGVTQIFSNGSAFAALKSDGSVVTWGGSGGDSSSVSSQLTSGVVSFADPFNDDRLVPLSTTPTTPTITLAVNPSIVTEDGTTNLVYTLTRTGDLTNSLIVNVNGGGTAVLDTDFSISGPIGQSTSGSIASVTFAAGSSTATVIVDPIPNSIPGGNKTVFATLAPGVGYNIGTVGAVTGTILEDDVVAPTLAIAPTNAIQTEGNSGTKAFPFTVTRSGDTTSSSSANWAVTGFGTNQADVTDFGGTLPTGTVNFTAGETSKTIIVDVLGDTTVEPDEGFTVTLSNPTNATITTATAVGTIQNDDVVIALDLVSQILGSGVMVKDAKFTGNSQAVGTFTNSSVGIGITSGIVLSSGKVADIYGNNDGNNISTGFSGAGDADLNKLVDGPTNDAAVLEFDFIPTDSFVSFDYVFASEEYKEFVNGEFNDVFGFFVTDSSGIKNIALIPGTIPGTQIPITVNNINHEKNANLYRDNPGSGGGSNYNTKFDGFTSVLTATTPVNPGQTYKFKLALADTSDSGWDSAVFIGKGLSSSSLVASNDSFLVTSASQASFDVLKNDFVSSGKPVIRNFNSVSDKGGKVSRDNNQTPTDLSDDKLLYTPPLDFNGIDTFQYTLGDGQNGTATGKVSIEVKNTSLAIASTNATQIEGNSGTKAFTFTVTRNGDPTSSSSANWSVTGSGTNPANGADFVGGTLPTGTVNFTAGETSKSITVNVLGDTTVEPDEGFTVTLSNPTNANITTGTATGTITNDDRTLTPITNYAPNVNISTGLVFSTNGGGNLSLDTNRLSMSNEVTGVKNGTKSNFNHLFGLYEVVDADGGINTGSGIVKPGDRDYAFHALTTARVKDFIVQAGNSDIPSTATQLGSGVSLQGNKFYAPFVIANCGTYFPNLQQGVEDFIAAENGDVNRFANAPKHVRDLVATEVDNEFNNAPRFVQEPVAYFSFGSANPDKSPHLRSYGNGVYGFEDLPATATQYSNNDFNDAVFALS